MKLFALQLTTANLHFLDCGLYNSILEPSMDHIEDESEAKETLENYSHSLFLEKMQEVFSWYINEFFCDNFNAEISNEKLISPRFYNYETDKLDFDLELPKGQIYRTILKALRKQNFAAWLKENYSSGEGLVCCIPDNVRDFKEYTKENLDLSFSISLNFLYSIGELDTMWDSKYSTFQHHIHMEECGNCVFDMDQYCPA